MRSVLRIQYYFLFSSRYNIRFYPIPKFFVIVGEHISARFLMVPQAFYFEMDHPVVSIPVLTKIADPRITDYEGNSTVITGKRNGGVTVGSDGRDSGPENRSPGP
jgi:hypothetical protein